MRLLIPWAATRPNVVKKMLQMAWVGEEDVVYDLGCGDARVLITAVKEFGARKAVGYEIREDLYTAAVGNIEQQNLHNRIMVIKKNLFDADLSDASVIAIYLSNEANELLRPKFEKEAKCGTRIVSHHFPINTWRATSKKAAGYFPDIAIYLYVIPEAFGQKHWLCNDA